MIVKYIIQYMCILIYTYKFEKSSEILRPRQIMLRNLDQTRKPYKLANLCSSLSHNVMSIAKTPFNKSQGVAKCFVQYNSVSRNIVLHIGAWYILIGQSFHKNSCCGHSLNRINKNFSSLFNVIYRKL